MEFSIVCSQSFLDLNVVAVENVIVMKLDTEFKPNNEIFSMVNKISCKKFNGL